MRKLLENHEGMDEAFPPRAFFNDFNPESFNLLIIYWYHPAKYWDFLAFSEKLNVQICRAFEAEEIPFSLPHKLTYMSPTAKPQALDVRMTGEAET